MNLCVRWLALGIGLGSCSAFAQGWQPFVLSKEAATLKAGHAAIELGGGFNGMPELGTARPEDAQALDTWASGAIGLTDGLEINGSASFGAVPTGVGLGSGRAELRLRLVDRPLGLPITLTLAGGYQVDSQLQHAAEGGLMVSSSLGLFRLTANLRVAHYFHQGRDPIDVFASVGAGIRLSPWLQLGAEYLGEELEAAVHATDVDIGGAGRHYVGPSATVFLPLGVRVSVTGGEVFTPDGAANMVLGSIACSL